MWFLRPFPSLLRGGVRGGVAEPFLVESLADFKLTSKPLPQRGRLGGGFLSSLEFLFLRSTWSTWRSILFWRIWNPTELRKSICNAISCGDYKSLNSKRPDCKSVRTRASKLQLSVPPLKGELEGVRGGYECRLRRSEKWKVKNQSY